MVFIAAHGLTEKGTSRSIEVRGMMVSPGEPAWRVG
jgi:hypothetical protein